jgi:hypothetical protein
MSVAIVVPVYRKELLPEEQVALRHWRRHLSGFPTYQVSPKSLSLRLEGFNFRGYDDCHFANVDAYSRLMLSRSFYESFSEYQHILIYQLDCVVFSNQLEHWCGTDFDYIGAPLFRVKGDAKSGFSGACNGGLSLRNTSSFLKVLNSDNYVRERVSFLKDVFHEPFVEVRPLPWMESLKKRVQVAREVRQGVDQYAAGYSLNEDHFWSSRAAYFHPGFRVAPPEVALTFAFEAAPSYCFERNGGKLPFGAHAWPRYDRAFWEPHLIPETSTNPVNP